MQALQSSDAGAGVEQAPAQNALSTRVIFSTMGTSHTWRTAARQTRQLNLSPVARRFTSQSGYACPPGNKFPYFGDQTIAFNVGYGVGSSDICR